MVSRDVQSSWLWKDPLYFQWWFDLLCLAAYTDRNVLIGTRLVGLRRGQLIGSINFFVRRWGKSKNMVIRFFKLLIADGMIEKVSSNNVTVITIHDYAQEQTGEGYTFGYRIDSFEGKPEGKPLNKKKDNLLEGVNDCNTERYDTTLNRPRDNLGDNPEDNLRDNPRDNLRDNLRDTKEKRKKINKNINCMLDVCVREGGESVLSGLSEKDQNIISELKENTSWQEAMCFKYHLGSVEEVIRYLDEFALSVVCRGNIHEDRPQLMNHFNRWLNIRLDIEEKENKNLKNKNTYGEDVRNNHEKSDAGDERDNQIRTALHAVARLRGKDQGDSDDLR